MIEVTKIDEKKEGLFKNGVYIGDQTMEKVDEEEQADRLRRGLPEIKDVVDNDIKDLKAYEKSCCCSEVCTTAIGHPFDPSRVNPPYKHRQRVFDSGLKVINMQTEKVPIDIPKDILNACDELQAHVGHNEFSIVCKGAWGSEGRYVIENGYKVPKQKVDGAAVDYDLDHLEELKAEGYNAVIHSHPFKSESFSSSDSETINSHFECSVLYSLRDFTTATIAISPVSGMKLIARGEPVIEGQNIVPKSELDNIEKKYKQNYGNDYRWYGDHSNFRGAGKHQNNVVNLDQQSCGCGNKSHRALARDTVDMCITNGFTYDARSDTLYDNMGNIIDMNVHKARGHLPPKGQRPIHVVNGDVQVRQIPRGVMPDNVFKVNQTRVFDSGKPDEVASVKNGKKSGKGKRELKENLPKIDLL